MKSKANIQANRLENFETLIREAGNVAELARRCGYNKAAYLYQVRGQNPKANGKTMQIGNHMAAKLENGMGKPHGWMDQNHKIAKAPNHSSSKDNIQTISLAFTGASGIPYGMRLLEVLLQSEKTVWLMYSQAAQIVAQQECNLQLPSSPEAAQKMLCERYNCAPDRLRVFGKDEWFAPVASGNSTADAMIVCPASMGCVAAIAHGTSDHLIERAADVAIKERRPLIIVPRETPLSALHLENLLKLAQLGCIILPPATGFYHKPSTLNDAIDFVVARILDQLRIPHALIPRWGEES